MFFLSTACFSQNDVILKTNGEEMEGKISSISDEEVVFKYKNESVDYKVNTSDISKITFASGRIQYFKTNSNQNNQLGPHHNKVAILPFAYLKDGDALNNTMNKKIQQEAYTNFKQATNQLQYQDPTTTNALLAKAGLGDGNYDQETMEEICTILGVEYVVNGIVSVDKTNVSNYSYGSSESNKKSNKKTSSNSSSYSTSVQNYSTTITMNIYSDKGTTLFTKDHNAWSEAEDAYKLTIKYLAKRTPIFKK